MKILLLTSLLLQFSLLWGQSKYDFKLTKSVEVGLNKSIHLNSNNCLCFKSDKNLSFLIMHHSNSGCKRNTLRLVDTADFSPYESNVHIFRSNNDPKTSVVLWETENENDSYILAYYLDGNQLHKIGRLKVILYCSDCEYFGYPIKSIRIQKVNENIEFSFLEDLEYWVIDDKTKFYKAEVFKYQYNINQKKLKIITHN